MRSLLRGAAIAVDVGGTTLKGAVFTDDGRLIVRRTIATFDARGGALATLVELIDALRAIAHRQGVAVDSIGVAVPGVIADGVVSFAANLGWRDLPLRSLLAGRFGMPVVIDHDARAAAVAEYAIWKTEHEGLEDFVFVPIGTGVSAAMVSGGRLIKGSTGGAGEFGHQVVVAGGDVCGCGQSGCVESYSSATNVLRRYRAAGGTEAQTTADVVDRLDVDPLAREVWSEAVNVLAAGLAAMTAMIDPQIIAIGGGLSAAGDRLLVPLRAETAKALTWRSAPTIVPARVGIDAGLIGAALVAANPPERVEFIRAAIDDCMSIAGRGHARAVQ